MKTKIISVLLVAFMLAACKTTKVKPEPFIIDKNSPSIEIGEIETQFSETFSISGIKKYALMVSYYPEEDAVCITFKNNFTTYQQFWSRDGRDAFAAAFARYNEAFEAKNLPNRRAKTTNRAYGVIEGFLIWQMLSFTTLCHTNMNVELGYGFYDRSPYFTVNQRSTQFIDPISPQDVFNSAQTCFYYTRAQTEEVLKLFDQQFLDGLALGGRRINVPTKDIDADEY